MRVHPFEWILLFTAVFSVLLVRPWRLFRVENPPSQAATREPAPVVWWLFLGINLLLFLNQVCFSAWVWKVHGGDSSVIGRYFPPSGWFEIPGPSGLVALAMHLPGDVLEWSVLRVQSVLEVPFALTACLTVAWALDRALYRWLLRWPSALAVLSWTLLFGVIELRLMNPWTGDDLFGRAFGAVLSLLLCRWLSRRDPGPVWPASQQRVTGFLSFMAWILLVFAMSAIVLAMCWAALLYNPAHFVRLSPVLIGATLLITLLFRLPLRETEPASKGVPASSFDELIRLLTAFFAVFLGPSMAIRYTLPRSSALLVFLFLGLATTLPTLVAIGRRRPRNAVVLCLAGGLGALMGGTQLFGLLDGFWLHSSSMMDLAVLQLGVIALTVIVGVASLIDRRAY